MPPDKQRKVVDLQGVEHEGTAVDIVQIRSTPIIVDLEDGTQLIVNISINQCTRIDELEGAGSGPTYTCNVGFNFATMLPGATEPK